MGRLNCQNEVKPEVPVVLTEALRDLDVYEIVLF